MGDLTLRRLTKKVFPYIWFHHKLMSSNPSTGIFPFSELSVFSQDIGNAVIVYLHVYRPTLSIYLEKHIPSMPQSKMPFWTHVAFLCLKVRLANDDAFDYFLTACSITAEVALYCRMNGYDDVLPLASVFFCAFFETELREGFRDAGGWLGLYHYIKDTSCPELYEFVNTHIKKISSPSERLPILIEIKREQLAALRREKIISLRSCKIGEIECQDQTKSLISGIFKWDFMENLRVSEVRPGILKRMENIRHKKNKSNTSMSEERSDESSEADEVLGADNKNSNDDKLSCLLEKAQTSESAATMFETRSNYKEGPTLEDLKCTEAGKENKNQLCTGNETSGKTKFNSSSSLRELRNFYERLSAPSEATMDNSKYFRSNGGTRNGLKSSGIKGKMSDRYEKVGHFERHKFVPNASENGETFPKSGNSAPETLIKSTESSDGEVLSELTESFQKLGFSCLCVGNSSHLDEKSGAFTNYEEIVEKCRYFQNKYSSMQFAILIPNDYITEKTSQAPGTENYDAIRFGRQCNEQQFPSITKKDFENFTVSPQRIHSETKKSTVTKVDENKSKDGTSILGTNCVNETTKINTFTDTKVDESKSKDGTSILGTNCVNETTKINTFTDTKVDENKSKDGTSILGTNCVNETTKINRFTDTKVDESKSGHPRSILKKPSTNETTKPSIVTVNNQPMSIAGASSLRKSHPTNATNTSRFSVTKVDESESRLSESNDSIRETSDDTENETVQFQDNGSVKYQRMVSFAEHPIISYYPQYSSDDSCNSKTSRESANQNSPEDSRSSRISVQSANQEDTPRNTPRSGRRGWFRRYSLSDNPSRDNARSSNASFSFRISRIFRRYNSRNRRVNESATEEMNQTSEQRNDELTRSLEAAGVENPDV